VLHTKAGKNIIGRVTFDEEADVSSVLLLLLLLLFPYY